jgi:serine/threonine-protein kinase SRPK3
VHPDLYPVMSLHRFHKRACSRLLHLEPPKRRFISISQNYEHSPPKREIRLNDDRILPHQERYRHGHSDALEDVELYRPGGLHPVTIGDVLDHGRYHLVHKLGDGKGSSTVWLARDLRSTGKSNSSENLVSTKIRRASNPDQERFRSMTAPREMQIVRALHNSAVNRGQSEICSHLLSIHSSFTEVGPNGTHVCLVSSAAGPSLYWMRYWRKHGRYHQQLVRKICQQVAESLQLIHASGYVHGGM